jgi:ferredoxin
VARQGDRAAGRRAFGAALHGPHRPADQGALRDSARERDWPLRNLKWDYSLEGPAQEPDPEEVLKEISGYETASGKPVDGFPDLKADGSTACGCWIYSGCFAGGVNQTRRRDPGDLEAPGGWVSPNWGWAWPANRRILYNRASADPSGRPWSERKRYVWWDEEKGDWTGYDVPDFPPGWRPDYRPDEDADGMDAIAGDAPFIMMPDGRAHLYSASGLLDAPLPTHYEPLESPARNELYPDVGANPVAITWVRPENPLADPDDPRWPHVASTFRLTEHHTAGPMSRNLPWLAELQPEMFAEIDPVLAEEAGIENGGWMVIETPRAEIEARAKVTNRVSVLRVNGRAPAPGLPAVALRHVHVQRAGRRRRCGQRPGGDIGRPERVDPRVQGVPLQRPRGAPRRGDDGAAGRDRLDARAGRPRRLARVRAPGARRPDRPGAVPLRRGEPRDMTEIAVHKRSPAPRMGFFTDTTTCIGLQGVRGRLQAVERPPRRRLRTRAVLRLHRRAVGVDVAACALRRGRRRRGAARLGSSCPTSASTARTPAAWTPARRAPHPDGVRDGDRAAGRLQRLRLLRARRARSASINRDPTTAGPAKCTLCYDRLEDGLEPACAKACPTDSIQFGEWDELAERATGARARAARSRALRAPICTAPVTPRASSSRAISARSSC